MIKAVLDASALIAFLRGEPGAENVAPHLGQACLSAVNFSEVVSKLSAYGKPAEAVAYQVERLRLPILPFDTELAKLAATLSPATREAGLSLGDRACLALGLKTGHPVVTADRIWETCDLGVRIITIR